MLSSLARFASLIFCGAVVTFYFKVNTDWNWGDVHVADLYLARLEQVLDFTSEE
jgi:hypothetical protein